MIKPHLFSRVIERRLLPSVWIYAKLKSMFGAVATDAGQAQIIQDGFSTSRAWDNVVDMHPNDDALLGLTILAIATSTRENAIAQTCRDIYHLKSSAELGDTCQYHARAA